MLPTTNSAGCSVSISPASRMAISSASGPSSAIKSRYDFVLTRTHGRRPGVAKSGKARETNEPYHSEPERCGLWDRDGLKGNGKIKLLIKVQRASVGHNFPPNAFGCEQSGLGLTRAAVWADNRFVVFPRVRDYDKLVNSRRDFFRARATESARFCPRQLARALPAVYRSGPFFQVGHDLRDLTSKSPTEVMVLALCTVTLPERHPYHRLVNLAKVEQFGHG